MRMARSSNCSAPADARIKGTGPLKVLTLTTLYPQASRPQNGVFIENRVRQLAASGVESRVVAPVPWIPGFATRLARYRRYDKAPLHEMRFGIPVDHPVYLLPPRRGMTAVPWFLYRAILPALRATIASGFDFDIIDAHYFYPDGVAAVMAARRLGKPITVSARGTDINVVPRHILPRRMIRWAALQADGVITVSAALKDGLAAIGVPAERIAVLRNGVDLDTFRPTDRATARARLDADRAVLLSVGNLVPGKRHDIAIAALPFLPGHELWIAGDGPMAKDLRLRAERLGVSGRVRFLGRVAHDELPNYYAAADILLLVSEREGWPNVLLEAMACGTPVIASAVGGVAEIVTHPVAGRVLRENSAEALAAAIGELATAAPDRAATRIHAEGFGWQETTAGQLELFADILRRRAA